ncbi:Peptidyl-tRNA hydrolase [Camellia lanceoleosa]|uniref:Peptidyl-tRNA hydrolase n=1 Tax=Camellia lanceoleosa TaxID=1840588 RepID=A0ACC0FKW0_9ERIC|nr:Peptidyl-tRNA hydrolase [Camellia lanceoleosa]
MLQSAVPFETMGAMWTTKIVVMCKNQQAMNRLKEAAESIGLPTFVVADAGRTQVLAGSKTVLAIGPGSKGSVDSVAGKLSLL